MIMSDNVHLLNSIKIPALVYFFVWFAIFCLEILWLTFAERKRWLFLLSGFANLSTKITNQREFRLSLFVLLSKNNQRFRSVKVKAMHCGMEWCDEKIELLINFSLQNTFLFGVKLSDYHNSMKRVASWSSAMNFDAINPRHFFVPDAIGTKNWRQYLASNLWRRFLASVSKACVTGLM